MSVVQLTTFGRPLLLTGAGAIPLPAERRFQLLAYLASCGEWVAREQLLVLFWPDHPAAAARRNLRRMLFDLRQLSWLGQLETTGDAVRWPVENDRSRFLDCCSRGDCDAAIRIASAPFLDGLEANATAPFDEWLRYERDRLFGRWRDAVDRRLSALRGDGPATRDLAESVLQVDPVNENAVLRLMQVHQAEDRAQAARRVFERYRARLASDLGVEPSSKFREHVRHETVRPSAMRATDPHFVGRRLELRELARLLRRPDVRRVNVLGPGGIGKSTLAREVLIEVAADFPGGIRWIELRELQDMAQAAGRTADVLGFEPAPGGDTWRQIGDRLGDARQLLVFDNCEHLADFGRTTDQLLEQCPALTILQTSRQRLGSRGEWVFPLAGLPVPDDDESELAAIQAFDAVRLFEKRALAVCPGFELGACVNDVVKLVRAFDGLPLAIELAAACVPVLSPAALVADVARAAALVDEVSAARPAAGGMALSASFARSWSVLGGHERAALARLSLFEGEFDRIAAEHVGGAALPLLTALCDRSLVRPRSDAHFDLHPLVREFARARLEDGAAAERHALYFARLLAECISKAASDRIHRIDRCLPDAVAAWRWACAHRACDALEWLAAPLATALDLTGRWSDGPALLAAGLAACADAREGQAARAEILRGIAMLHFRRGEFDLAEQRARESLRMVTAQRTLRGAESCLNLIGGALRQRGEWREAERYFERALRRAAAVGELVLAHRIGNNLASAEMGGGRTAAAVDRCRALLERHRATSDPLATAMTLVVLGNGLHALGRFEEALQHYRDGLELTEEHALGTLRPFFLFSIGSTLRHLLRPGEARSWFERVLACPHERLELQVAIDARLGLARLQMGSDPAAAAGRLREALALAMRAASPGWQTNVVAACGEWFAARGDMERAGPLLAFASASGAIDANDARAAEAALSAALQDPERIERARTGAAALVLGAVVAQLQADPGLCAVGPTPG